MVGNTKEGPNFAQFALLSKGVVLRQLWTQRGLMYLGLRWVVTHSVVVNFCGTFMYLR
jgi:hypothetical protein